MFAGLRRGRLLRRRLLRGSRSSLVFFAVADFFAGVADVAFVAGPPSVAGAFFVAAFFVAAFFVAAFFVAAFFVAVFFAGAFFAGAAFVAAVFFAG